MDVLDGRSADGDHFRRCLDVEFAGSDVELLFLLVGGVGRQRNILVGGGLGDVGGELREAAGVADGPPGRGAVGRWVDVGGVDVVGAHTPTQSRTTKTLTTTVNSVEPQPCPMGGKNAETCGRCAMSSASGLIDDPSDPFDGPRIEVDETEARRISPAAWLEGVKSRLDDWATGLTYGR